MPIRSSFVDVDAFQDCYGYRRSIPKTLLAYIGIVLTLGIARLVFHWQPHWYLKCTYDLCSLAEATKVLLVDQYDQIFVEDVRILTAESVR